MKKLIYLIILLLILGLVLTGCFLSNVGQVPATEQSGVSNIAKNSIDSICFGFEDFEAGEDITVSGIVWDYLEIYSSKGELTLEVIKVDPDTVAGEEVSYNTTGVDNGCLNGSKGFGPVGSGTENRPLNTNNIVFEFQDGVTVSTFSIEMFDYGDYIHFPDSSVAEFKVTLIAHKKNGDSIEVAYIITDGYPITSTKYDACHFDGNGKHKFTVTGEGINKVELKFEEDIDIGVGFDDICFTPEPIICSTYLQAGNPKNGENDVGDVMVEYIPGNDYLTVTYTTDEPWLMNEIHFHAASSEPDSTWPVTKKGNPIPGHFDWVFEDLEGDEKTEKTFTILIPEEVTCGELYFTAHAAVEKIIEPAPRYPSAAVNFNQGLRKDGTAVTEGRSNTLQGLVYEANNVETDFFSLGFGGWIIVEFDCPIPNGEGDDLRIIEDTWGTYPLETAEVYASQDGSTWVPLGEANNTLRETGDNFHSFSAFDLGSLEWAKYIKVVDTTNPALHGSTADGFDLNAVEALQDCIQEETAWGDGPGFPGAKNWSMYFGCLDLVPCPF